MSKGHYRALGACIIVCVTLFIAFWWNERVKASTGPAQHPYRIEVILKAYNSPPDFWRVVGQGVQAAEKEFGVTCRITAPQHENDVDVQIELVRQAIARKPDAILLAASDYTQLAPVCAEATKAGILLATVDSDVDFDGRSVFVGTDNYEMGKKLAGLLQAEIGDAAPFGVISHVKGAATATARLAGLMDNTKNTTSRMVGFDYCEGYETYAKQLTIRMLEEHPEIECMVGLNESSALGIANALEELGLAGKIKLVVCDSSEKQIQFLENGTIQACVVQNPFSMGYMSVSNVVSLLNKQNLPRVIYTDSVVVHKSDLNSARFQQLIIPFTQ